MDTHITFPSYCRTCLFYFSLGGVNVANVSLGKKLRPLIEETNREYLAQDCSDVPYEYSRLIQLFQQTNQAFPFEGNRVAVYTEGYTKLQSLLRELQKRSSISTWNITSLKMTLSGVWSGMLIEKALTG